MPQLKYVNLLLIVFSLLWGPVGQASELLWPLREEQSYQQYYLIELNPHLKKTSLLNWSYHYDPEYTPPPPYKRTTHFEGWITDPTHQTCFDVRGLVLQRQALQPIVLDPNNRCRIDSAAWYDPYSDEYFLKSKDLQIDHVVPLKHAYLAGAYEWTQAKRCHYANFIQDPEHLIAVQKFANLSKGERGPDAYLPVNSRFQCQYLGIWLHIKAVWNLKISTTEAKAISDFLNQTTCPMEFFEINLEVLQYLKNASHHPPEACLNASIRPSSLFGLLTPF